MASCQSAESPFSPTCHVDVAAYDVQARAAFVFACRNGSVYGLLQGQWPRHNLLCVNVAAGTAAKEEPAATKEAVGAGGVAAQEESAATEEAARAAGATAEEESAATEEAARAAQMGVRLASACISV